MKTNSLVFACVVLIAATSSALASDEAKADKAAKKDRTVAATTEKKGEGQGVRSETQTSITGSYLKQKVRRNGLITDGVSQVVVLDRSNIERTGATSVRQLLNRYGVH
jgi:outer membrane cobalamin receptor